MAELPDPIAFLREKGMDILTPSEKDLETFRSVTRPVVEKWKTLIGHEVVGAAARDLGESP